MVQFRVTFGSEAQALLDGFCEASGASRSEVLEKLVEGYMDQLCEEVAAVVEPEEDEEEEEVDAEADEEEDTDEDEEEEEA